jgi:hypothetical protein
VAIPRKYWRDIPLGSTSKHSPSSSFLSLEDGAKGAGHPDAHKRQGKVRYPKRRGTRKCGMAVKAAGDLWYSLDRMRVFILGVGAMGSLLTKLLLRQGH